MVAGRPPLWPRPPTAVAVPRPFKWAPPATAVASCRTPDTGTGSRHGVRRTGSGAAPRRTARRAASSRTGRPRRCTRASSGRNRCTRPRGWDRRTARTGPATEEKAGGWTPNPVDAPRSTGLRGSPAGRRGGGDPGAGGRGHGPGCHWRGCAEHLGRCRKATPARASGDVPGDIGGRFGPRSVRVRSYFGPRRAQWPGGTEPDRHRCCVGSDSPRVGNTPRRVGRGPGDAPGNPGGGTGGGVDSGAGGGGSVRRMATPEARRRRSGGVQGGGALPPNPNGWAPFVLRRRAGGHGRAPWACRNVTANVTAAPSRCRSATPANVLWAST